MPFAKSAIFVPGTLRVKQFSEKDVMSWEMIADKIQVNLVIKFNSIQMLLQNFSTFLSIKLSFVTIIQNFSTFLSVKLSLCNNYIKQIGTNKA